MNLSVVIPNYNGQELLKKNLPNVFYEVSVYKKGQIEIIVIDDCSSDGSLEVLENLKTEMRRNYPEIKFKIIKNEKNLGFSSNVNRGVKNSGGNLVVLLNTDVSPKRNFLSPLVDHFSDPKIFAVGCMDESVENGGTVLRGRGIGRWKKGFLIHSRGEVNKDSTLWVSGGSGAFRKSIWEKLGGLNSLYNPFYWEDIDLSYRALKSGYKILFESKSVVVHEHEKGAIKDKFSSSYVKTIAYRNQFIFVWKNATDLNLQILHLLWLPYHFIKALVRFDTSFFKGFFSAFSLLPQIIECSIGDKKLFVISDRKTMSSFGKE
ncbi:MAG: glycosyltransferase family 2 protein [Candidatus Levybacteria bacterium]|nr:glycosyltransferase family 2 protein [Candidatus Levybacteria bacterium]